MFGELSLIWETQAQGSLWELERFMDRTQELGLCSWLSQLRAYGRGAPGRRLCGDEEAFYPGWNSCGAWMRGKQLSDCHERVEIEGKGPVDWTEAANERTHPHILCRIACRGCRSIRMHAVY